VDDARVAQMSTALGELPRTRCIELLGQAHLGRVGVSIDALPAIFPVFVTLIDGTIVFRTVPGTKLAAALAGAIVAVEVDAYDAATGEGWSVLVRGVAREVDTTEPLAATARERLDPSWMNGAPEHLVGVSTDLVTGRRLH
jgi:nitroimidazol reductase NimA-like FMN-containing flavoprotein (pyridoxamine 5'-phosphate oxidase superfamily)